MATGRKKKSRIIFLNLRKHSSLTGPPGSFKWRGMRRIFCFSFNSFVSGYVYLDVGSGGQVLNCMFRKMQSVTISGRKRGKMQQVTICLAAEKMVAEKANYPIIEKQGANGENKWKQIEGKERKNNQFVALSAAERNNKKKWNRKASNCLTFYGLAFLFQLDPFFVDGTGSYPLT